MKPPRRAPRPSAGLARVLSKLGVCSRNQARERILAGRVTVNGAVVRDPDRPVPAGARIELDGTPVEAARDFVYLMLNKPRGLVTTSWDERGRNTVFACFEGANLPRLIAVGRLDQASEGLLLFTNDTAWANAITDPATHLDKTYHVQIDTVADAPLLDRLRRGVVADGEELRAKDATLLRAGEKNSWLELTLDEGRNRHIRRMLDALNISVLRLVRVAIGGLTLGALPKGRWRALSHVEAASLQRTKRR